MKAIKILKKMLDLTNELAKLNKQLEGQVEFGPEWLTVNAIEKAIGLARTAYEQRLNKEKSK